MTNYPIADFLIRIKNAYMAGKQSLTMPYSNEIFNVGKILKEEKYISDIKVVEDKSRNSFKFLELKLHYTKNMPAISEVKMISKPSAAVYAKKEDMKKISRKFGTSILTTNQGVMTIQSAIKKGVGGKLICHIS